MINRQIKLLKRFNLVRKTLRPNLKFIYLFFLQISLFIQTVAVIKQLIQFNATYLTGSI